MSSTNLIPLHRLQARRRAVRTRRWIVGSAVYAFFLLSAYAGVRAAWDYDHEALGQQLGAAAGQNESQRKAIMSLKAQVQNARKTLEANLAVGSQPDWSILLALLAECNGPETVLRACRLSPIAPEAPALTPTPAPSPGPPATAAGAPAPIDPPQPSRYQLTIRGLATTQKGAVDFTIRLEQTGLFDRVDLAESKMEPFRTSQAVAFRIECTLGPAPAGEVTPATANSSPSADPRTPPAPEGHP